MLFLWQKNAIRNKNSMNCHKTAMPSIYDREINMRQNIIERIVKSLSEFRFPYTLAKAFKICRLVIFKLFVTCGEL